MESITQNKRVPENFIEHDSTAIISNFDREIDEDIVNEVKGKEVYGRYAGWNFNGLVWWQDNQWHCEVWCYGSYRKTFSCDTLEEIMDEVSDEFGHD